MSSWSALLADFKQELKQDPNWLDHKLKQQLAEISKIRKGAAVIFYASAFLQKASPKTSIRREDVNGFMNALYQVPAEKGLTLILHTPGGDPNAAESIIDYLHSKFSYIEVIVPYLAMSAGGGQISYFTSIGRFKPFCE